MGGQHKNNWVLFEQTTPCNQSIMGLKRGEVRREYLSLCWCDVPYLSKPAVIIQMTEYFSSLRALKANTLSPRDLPRSLPRSPLPVRPPRRGWRDSATCWPEAPPASVPPQRHGQPLPGEQRSRLSLHFIMLRVQCLSSSSLITRGEEEEQEEETWDIRRTKWNKFTKCVIASVSRCWLMRRELGRKCGTGQTSAWCSSSSSRERRQQSHLEGRDTHLHFVKGSLCCSQLTQQHSQAGQRKWYSISNTNCAFLYSHLSGCGTYKIKHNDQLIVCMRLI